MTDALVVQQKFSPDKIALLKATIAKGTTDDEFELFMYACEHTGLDPFLKQIHPVKRWNSKERREVMAIQTGIDGYRLIADRTGKYAGSDDPEFGPEVNGFPSWSRVTVWKMVGNQRFPFTRTARWAEYVQTNKEGEVNPMWRKMPYVMIAKCAEALTLRVAFPAELSVLRTDEEMMQADAEVIPVTKDAQRNALQQKAADMSDVVTGEFHEVKKNPRDYALPESIVGDMEASDTSMTQTVPPMEPEPATVTTDKPSRGQRLTMIQDLFGQLKKKDPKSYNGYWESGHIKKHYSVTSKSDMTEEQLEAYRNELVELLNPQEDKNVPASSN